MVSKIKEAVGVVKSYNKEKGYGFISCDDNLDEDIYVHFSEVLSEEKSLIPGEEVEFKYKTYTDEAKGIKEKLRAYQVRKKERIRRDL